MEVKPAALRYMDCLHRRNETMIIIETMDGSERDRKEWDIVFQERLEAQAKAADGKATKHLASWFQNELTRSFMRKRFFRAMSKEQQQEFVRDSIREYKRRTAIDSDKHM